LIPTDAVVYLPDDVEDDRGLLARRGIAHAERRGYRLVGVLRDLTLVLRLAGEGTVVVFTRHAHWASRRPEIDGELVGEETCRLIPLIRPGGEAIARVGEILDGVAPVPTGLDPESIAAARRIARRLSMVRNG